MEAGRRGNTRHSYLKTIGSNHLRADLLFPVCFFGLHLFTYEP